MTASSHGAGDLEIERKWLLRALPERLSSDEDPSWECWRLCQGYLPSPSAADLDRVAGSASDPGTEREEIPRVGRLRSIEPLAPARGPVGHIHTLKLGSGLVRREIERAISAEVFQEAWAGTEGRRLEKIRWRVPEEGVVWEIDRFDAPAAVRGMVLVEAEATDEASARALQPPGWIAELVEREVTHEPAFTNAEIAFRTGLPPD